MQQLHGEAYGYDADEGPSIELAVHFQSHGFKERKYSFSTTGEAGMGDSWGALAVPSRGRPVAGPSAGFGCTSAIAGAWR